jgi:hypothetical protein
LSQVIILGCFHSLFHCKHAYLTNLSPCSHLKKDKNGFTRIFLNKTIKTAKDRTTLMRRM